MTRPLLAVLACLIGVVVTGRAGAQGLPTDVFVQVGHRMAEF